MTGIFNKKCWLVIGILLTIVLLPVSKIAASEEREIEEAAEDQYQAELEGQQTINQGEDRSQTTMSPEDQAALEFFQEWTAEERAILDFFETDNGQAIQNRQDNDQQQTQTESETLSDLQQQDLEQCTLKLS